MFGKKKNEQRDFVAGAWVCSDQTVQCGDTFGIQQSFASVLAREAADGFHPRKRIMSGQNEFALWGPSVTATFAF